MPGSFAFEMRDGTSVRIEYSIKGVLGDQYDRYIHHKKVFQVREYLFTPEEMTMIEIENKMVSEIR